MSMPVLCSASSALPSGFASLQDSHCCCSFTARYAANSCSVPPCPATCRLASSAGTRNGGRRRSAAGLHTQVGTAVGGGGLGGLVNNAGLAVTAPVEFLPLDVLRAQLEVNLVGAPPPPPPTAHACGRTSTRTYLLITFSSMRPDKQGQSCVRQSILRRTDLVQP